MQAWKQDVLTGMKTAHIQCVEGISSGTSYMTPAQPPASCREWYPNGTHAWGGIGAGCCALDGLWGLFMMFPCAGVTYGIRCTGVNHDTFCIGEAQVGILRKWAYQLGTEWVVLSGIRAYGTEAAGSLLALHPSLSA